MGWDLIRDGESGLGLEQGWGEWVAYIHFSGPEANSDDVFEFYFNGFQVFSPGSNLSQCERLLYNIGPWFQPVLSHHKIVTQKFDRYSLCRSPSAHLILIHPLLDCLSTCSRLYLDRNATSSVSLVSVMPTSSAVLLQQ